MDHFEQELRDELGRLARGLDALSYYDFLGVTSDVDYVAIRDAFYAQAQRYHPDRYVRGEFTELRDSVYQVFKRMTEAYNVLSDPDLRTQYDAALQAGEHRLPLSARSRRSTAEERRLNNPFSRIYWRAAQEKLRTGDVNGAWIDVELGLSVEESEVLRKLHSEIVRRAATKMLS